MRPPITLKNAAIRFLITLVIGFSCAILCSVFYHDIERGSVLGYTILGLSTVGIIIMWVIAWPLIYDSIVQAAKRQ